MGIVRGFFNKSSNDSKQEEGKSSNSKENPSAWRVLDLPPNYLENIRTLLFDGFSDKDIKSLINQLPYFKLYYDGLPVDSKKYLSKKSLIDVLLRELRGVEELNTLLLLTKELKPTVYESHSPYLPENVLPVIPDNETKSEAPGDEGQENNHIQGSLISSLRSSGEDEFRKKKLRRQIREEFGLLSQKGENCEENDVIDLYIRYLDEITLMKEALSDNKNSKNKAAHLIWILLLEGVSADRTELFLKRKLVNEKRSRVEKAIPPIVTIAIEPNLEGPNIGKLSQEFLIQFFGRFLDEQDLDFSLESPSFPYKRLGVHDISIDYSDNIQILRKIQLFLEQPDMPIEYQESLQGVSAIAIAEQDDPITSMQSYLAASPSSDILDYYPRLGEVLITAHQLGYWNITWVQDILQDWLFEQDDYILAKSSQEYVKGQLLPDRRSKKNEDTRSSDKLIISIDKLFSLLTNSISKPSEVNKIYQTSFHLVKRDIVECEIKDFLLGNVPSSYRELNDELLNYTNRPKRELADRFLKLARKFAEIGRDSFFRFSLEIYCHSMSDLLKDKKREARPYLQIYLFLHNQNFTENRNQNSEQEFYQALMLYLHTYSISFDFSATSENASEEFYSNWIETIARASGRISFEAIGRCIVEIAAGTPPFIADFVNRMKTVRNNNVRASKALRKLTDILQEQRVFRLDSFTCLQLINRIDSDEIPIALSRQNLAQNQSSVEFRRQVSIALIKLGNASNVSPDTMLRGFAQHASNDLKNNLAFSILVEPYFLNNSKENELKEKLIVDVLGFPTGTKATELFGGRIKELSDLFDSFSRSTAPNVKGPVGITILETIRITRKWLAEELRGDLRELMFQFFRTVEGYTTAEQSKLIHDTTLEMSIASDRAVHSPTQTRITLEIRNVGEGMADGLELNVIPREGQYNVEERFRKIAISNVLADKTPLQIEIYIQPLIGVNKSLALELLLKYNTLRNKSKILELSPENNTVYLYPEAQFIRVGQPYSISAPATTWFYGRQDLLQSIADNLHRDMAHDTSMFIYGLKRAGKTSVVQRFIHHTLKERGLDGVYTTIYADMLVDKRAKKIKTDGDFLFYIMQVLNDMLPKSLRLEPDLFYEAFINDPFTYFSNTIETILSAAGTTRYLVVLDEFSELYPKLKTDKSDEASLTSDVFSFLSNFIQKSNQLTFIFTGTYVLLEMMREHAFDLAKICTPRLVSFLDEESARLLVTEPTSKDENIRFAKGWLEYDPRVVDQIVDISGRHPYLIQNICMMLVDRMNEMKLNHVNLRDLDTVINNIITQPSYEMILLALWKEFDDLQHKLLSVIATSSSDADGWVDINEINKVYEDHGDQSTKDDIVKMCLSLADAALLEKSNFGEGDLYRITIPLYQIWLKQTKPISAAFKE